jgi:lipopolysaccharide/colanic/teichoic acid biosynthesis glycosyltransferase
MHAESHSCLQANRSASEREPANGAPAGTPPPLRRLPSLAPVRSRRVLYGVFKRAFDLVLSIALLVLTAPLLLFAMLVVKLTSRGPVFYWQTRLGCGGRPFTIYKIRTMYHECEKVSGARWCKPGDPRIIPLGRLLRRLHLDELPQLWNILRGDMSLIGPRPERPEFLPQLERALPRYRERLDVRPGLTGFAQVQLPPDTDLNSARLKLAYDLFYVRRLSLLLDLRILIGTALHVVGLPWSAVRVLMRFPRTETVAAAYRDSVSVEHKPADRNSHNGEPRVQSA